MDLDDDEMKANKNKTETEKILESLDNEIKTLQNIIDFDNDFDYWEKEIYCLEILKKIRKGEIIKWDIQI